MRIVPRKSATAAPNIGLIFKRKAMPSPGSAMCDTTSPAKLMRFIKAKLPTSPAATAVSRTRMMEYVSEADIRWPKNSPAMPADVRKAFGLPADCLLDFGLSPIVGAKPQIHCEPERKRGALPHIR